MSDTQGPSVTPTPAGSNPEKFDYTKYVTPGITIDQLDKFAKDFFSATGASWIVLTLTGLRLIVALAYIWARSKLVDQELIIAKQTYMQNQVVTNENDISSDNLDTNG